MSKKKWSIILAIFFLVQATALPPSALSANYPLTQIKIDSGSPDQSFRTIYDAVCKGLFLYELDALNRAPVDQILRDHGRMLTGSDVKFDLANMDIGKKGYTRYYPFAIGEKNFIMRIFLTSERRYQHQVTVLYEGNIENPALTFQVLPSLNEILSSCRIKPIRTFSTRNVDSSS